MFVINNHGNNSFFCNSCSIMRTVTPILQPLEEKQVRLMKESKCFSYKEKGHTIYNYPKKEKTAAIIEFVMRNSNSQRKHSIFKSQRKKTVYFTIIISKHLFCERFLTR